MPNYASTAGVWRSQSCDVRALPLPHGRGSDRSRARQEALAELRFDRKGVTFSSMRRPHATDSLTVAALIGAAPVRKCPVRAAPVRKRLPSYASTAGAGRSQSCDVPTLPLPYGRGSDRSRARQEAVAELRFDRRGVTFSSMRRPRATAPSRSRLCSDAALSRSEPRPLGSGCRTALRPQGRNILKHATSARYRSLTVAALIGEHALRRLEARVAGAIRRIIRVSSREPGASGSNPCLSHSWHHRDRRSG